MKYIKREIEQEIHKWINAPEILAIRGPRQCGKTTLLFRIKEKLIQQGMAEKNIHYITFEDDLVRLKFEEDQHEFVKMYNKEGKNYFFLDEVQYVKEIGKKLKLIFDIYPNIKMIITGSSSFELTNLGKYLVGRVIFFNIYPFSFLEFLRAKGEQYERLYQELKSEVINTKELKKTIFLEDLNKLLHEYLTFGAYPRVVIEKDREKRKQILRSIFTTYVEKDVISLYGNRYRDYLVKVLKTLAYNIGGIIKYEQIIQNTGLSYREVKELVPLLEDSFVIKRVTPFYKNLSNELRKNLKIYFIDYGIRNYLLENFENLQFDFLYENFIYNQLNNQYHLNYWRTTAKTEIDFIIQKADIIIPLEVKKRAKITRAMRSFIEVYKPKKAIIANLTGINKEKIADCSVENIPFCYF